jgi:putative ATPase
MNLKKKNNNNNNNNSDSDSDNNKGSNHRFYRSPSPLKTATKCIYTSKTGITLEVCSGDITKEEVDAICNAANSNLMLGGGVAGAIERAGGDAIQEECDIWTDTYGRVKDGECGLSTGGKMKCKYVIHTVGPTWSTGHRGEDKELLYAVYNSFKMLNDLKLESISIPAISSGIFGFPKDRCAKIMFHAFFQYVKNFSDETSLKKVRFTNFDKETVDVFYRRISKYFW